MTQLDAARVAVAALDPAAIGASRWYAGGQPEAIELVDALLAPEPVLAVVDVVAGETRARYSLPLGERPWAGLLGVVATGRPIDGVAGAFVPRPRALHVPEGATVPLDLDQTNTSVVAGGRLVAKLYRRLEAGRHPEAEVVAALRIDEVPAFRGTLSYRDAAGGESTLLLLQDYVAGAESGWDAYIERLVAICADSSLLEPALAGAASYAAAAARVHGALADALPTAAASASALAAETGDWLHVDVYLSKHPGYTALLFPGSRFDAGVLEWLTKRSAHAVSVGRATPGSGLTVPFPQAGDPLVQCLVETGVSELVAAELWGRQAFS